MPGKNDFANYRKMSEPFASPEEADQALRRFFEIVELARKECRIMDVHVIAKIIITREDVDAAAMGSAHFGNSLEAIPMCAWSLGQEKYTLETAVNNFMKTSSQSEE